MFKINNIIIILIIGFIIFSGFVSADIPISKMFEDEYDMNIGALD